MSAALRASALLVLLLCTSCGLLAPRRIGPAPDRVSAPDAPTALPARWCGDLVLLDVEVEGRGPFRFLLDTGASWCVVSPALAEEAGDRATIDHGVTAAEGDVVSVTESVRLDELRCGGWVVSGVDALVVDLTAASEVLHVRLDGILGWPALRDVLLEVDGPGRSVSVWSGRLPPPDGRRVLHLHGSFLPHVQLATPRGLVRVLVDSGGAGSLGLLEWPAETFVVPPAPWFRSVTLAGLGERRRVARPDVDVVLGDFVLEDPVVTLTRGTARLGARVLREFRVVFDARRSRVLLDRAHVPADRRRAVRVGAVPGTGALTAGLGARWEVWDVVPGSPAERVGLRVGDVVVAVDGRPPDSADLLCPSPRGRERADGQRLTLLRDGDLVDVVVPVVELVP